MHAETPEPVRGDQLETVQSTGREGGVAREEAGDQASGEPGLAGDPACLALSAG